MLKASGGNQLLSFCIEVSAAGLHRSECWWLCGCRLSVQRMQAGCRRWAWRHVPAHLAGHAIGGRAHLGLTPADGVRRQVACRVWWRRHPLPALAQAARATCRLGILAATRRWCFLTNNFGGGLFCHFIGRGGLICQKFGQDYTYCLTP
jgi:hypothetical protein